MNIMFAFSGKITHLYLVAALFFSSCNTAPSQPAVCTGCERTELYLQKLNGKSVGLVANHTTVIGTEHLADFLIRQGIGLTRIFAPEHSVEMPMLVLISVTMLMLPPVCRLYRYTEISINQRRLTFRVLI
jgi:hypothetical protein